MIRQPEQPTAANPVILVIFGITGDLAKRKLLPALYHLFKDGLLPAGSVILGISRRDVTVSDLLADVELCINEQDNICDPQALQQIRQALRMHQMDMSQTADYRQLYDVLNHIETEQGTCMDRLYYLSIPPQVLGPIISNLGSQGLSASCKHGVAAARLLVEKPFGYDLASATDLVTTMAQSINEDQLFRIDHYLAKETAQNIITFRTNNPLFSAIWNDRHITKIEIIAAEQIGIEGRGNFYDQVGALRDFVQSHLLQLLSVVTMDLPAAQSSQPMHAARLARLQSIHLSIKDDKLAAWRGQYNSYRSEVTNRQSDTETYAAVKLHIDDPDWRKIPIILASGKKLSHKQSEVRIYFGKSIGNRLTFRLQPNEGIDIIINAKHPGFEDRTDAVKMDFSYQNAYNDHGHPDAYERVLIDAMHGDHTLFTTSDEALAAWRVLQPVLDAWNRQTEDLLFYDDSVDIRNLPPFITDQATTEAAQK